MKMELTYASNLDGMQMLFQLFNEATHDASDAMNCWTRGQITLSLEEVGELPLEDACGCMDCGCELRTMVVLTLEGKSEAT
jgi:hypothetical protein